MHRSLSPLQLFQEELSSTTQQVQQFKEQMDQYTEELSKYEGEYRVQKQKVAVIIIHRPSHPGPCPGSSPLIGRYTIQ